MEPLKALFIPENYELELNVEFEANEDCRIQWYRNNQILDSNEDCAIVIEKDRSVIKIKDVNKKKIGKYEVVIESANKIVKSASTVKLLKNTDDDYVQPPKFVKTIKPISVNMNDIVVIDATVDSNPPASFQWFIGTKEVTLLAKEQKLDNIYVRTCDNSSSLCIENINNDFKGIITCRAENFGGSVSCSASLEINEVEIDSDGFPPAIVVPLESTIVMDGDSIILNCVVTGVPIPKINWYHNKTQLKKARDIQFARQGSGICELKIKEAFPEMSGVYSCTAINKYGRCTSECVVTVEGRIINKSLIICMIKITQICMIVSSK